MAWNVKAAWVGFKWTVGVGLLVGAVALGRATKDCEKVATEYTDQAVATQRDALLARGDHLERLARAYDSAETIFTLRQQTDAECKSYYERCSAQPACLHDYLRAR